MQKQLLVEIASNYCDKSQEELDVFKDERVSSDVRMSAYERGIYYLSMAQAYNAMLEGLEKE